MSIVRHAALTSLVFVVASPAARAEQLYSNGSFVTSPNGGTGPIAGLPLSRPEVFSSGGGAGVSTTGVGAGALLGVKASDDFTVPAGGWDLDQLVVYGFQTYASNATTYGQTVTKAYINLWNSTPYTADSPDLPAGTPIPQPLLSAPLTFDVSNRGVLAAHRTSGSSTTTVRPVYAWTLSADDLPNGGRLAAGTYWLEMSFEGIGPQTNNVFVPLVTPRANAVNTNARLYTVPLAGLPPSWFEGREGYQSAAQPGRAYALPFELFGTPLPEPVTLAGLGTLGVVVGRRRR